MRISIISIGSELLIGHTVNTNLAFIGDQLARAGYTVDREICIPDDPATMETSMRHELVTADLVITIGGLGPTSDDLTRKVAAGVIGAELREEPEVRKHIEKYLGSRLHLIPEAAIRLQSEVPIGATALLNYNGTAPGLWCPTGNRLLVLLPGPPRELRPLFTEAVLPRLIELWEADSCRRSLHIYGIPESTVADRLEQAITLPDQVELAYCARAGEIDIRLTAPPALAASLDQLLAAIKQLFGTAALSGSADLVKTIADSLTLHGWRLAVTESCTGGMIGARITEHPGASAFFNGGIICYSNQSKINLLAVSKNILARHGAVSEETVRAMVKGAQSRMKAETAIAVTGIAGPEGGTAEKPVGLVYIATAVNEAIRSKAYNFSGNRERIRSRIVTTALNDLRIHLLNSIPC